MIAMTRHVRSIAGSALLLAAACSSSSDDVCGAGQATDFEGETYCMYRAAITEEGFMCPPALMHRFDFDGFSVCAESEMLPDGFEDHARRELGLERDGGVPLPDGSVMLDAGMLDAGEGSCWDGWDPVLARTTATTRPDPATSPAMRLELRYGETAEGRGEIVLENIAGETVVGTEDGPFMVGTHSGSWIELRDASDATVYTRGIFELVPESVEAPGPDGGFVRADTCPEPGTIRLNNFENDAAATHLVLFGEPLDGTTTSEASQELARFTLP